MHIINAYKEINLLFINNNMIILIAGSSGYIGSNVLNKLSGLESENEIIQLDIKNEFNPVNVLNEDDVCNFFNTLKEKYDKIDVFINCIGIPDTCDKLTFNDITDITLDSFKNLIDINLTATFVLIREFVRYYPNSDSNIINISSIYSEVSPRLDLYNGSIKNPGYIASKTGLVGLTKYLAVLIAKYNIKINCIAPAAVKDTPGVEGEFLEKYNKQVPLERPVNFDDIMKVINMLINNENITGQNIIIDGGYSLW